MKLPSDFFRQDPVACARELIGTEFHWDGCAGIVVETEAYAEHGDPACHTFFRPSARKFVAESEPGTAYVYLNYGMYWLTNVLVKGDSGGGFVLIRALEPVSGIDLMRQRRQKDRLTDLCSGPGKLSAALGIGAAHHGTSLVEPQLPARGFFRGQTSVEVIADVRIGISAATDLPWRFLAAGSPFVSVKPRSGTPTTRRPPTDATRPAKRLPRRTQVDPPLESDPRASA
jgi:DNA-3-methyladenine glycosylase